MGRGRGEEAGRSGAQGLPGLQETEPFEKRKRASWVVVAHTFEPSTWVTKPLIPALGRHMPLIPELGRWRQDFGSINLRIPRYWIAPNQPEDS